MTTSEFRKKLIELALSEKEDGRIAKIIAYYYPSLNLDSRESLFESIFRFFKVSENQSFDFNTLAEDLHNDANAFDVNSYRGKDYRIKNIEISSLRGIPEEDDNGIPFGINLFDEGIINNAIIFANNGNGKSSIFAGVEMIFAQEIGEKNLRSETYSDLNIKHYESYIRKFGSESTSQCKVVTLSGDFNLDNPLFPDVELRKVFNPGNSFISDFDIYENGKVRYNGDTKDSNSLHSIVARSLGLEEYLQIQNLLLQIPGYRRLKESNRKNSIEKQFNEQKDLLKNANTKLQSKQTEIKELKSLTNVMLNMN